MSNDNYVIDVTNEVINIDVNPGGTGPQGPAGEQGPAGPDSITGLINTNWAFVRVDATESGIISDPSRPFQVISEAVTAGATWFDLETGNYTLSGTFSVDSIYRFRGQINSVVTIELTSNKGSDAAIQILSDGNVRFTDITIYGQSGANGAAGGTGDVGGVGGDAKNITVVFDHLVSVATDTLSVIGGSGGGGGQGGSDTAGDYGFNGGTGGNGGNVDVTSHCCRGFAYVVNPGQAGAGGNGGSGAIEGGLTGADGTVGTSNNRTSDHKIRQNVGTLGFWDETNSIWSPVSINNGVMSVGSSTTLSGTNTGDQNLLAYATTSAVAAGYQPKDSDLTSIAALTTTSTGRSLLTESVTPSGSGGLVRVTSATLVTPALGTPSGLVGTNITGTAASLTAGNVTTNANLTGHITSTGNAAVLGSFTSAQLATALTDETGSGANVFGTSPSITTPILSGDIVSSSTSVPTLSLKCVSSQTAPIVTLKNSSGTTMTTFSKDGEFAIDAQSGGLYGIIVKKLGVTQFNVTADSGQVAMNGSINITAFGQYVGVNANSRIVFNSTDVSIYSPNSTVQAAFTNTGTALGWFTQIGNSRVNANVTNATTTFANITGLTATLLAARKYAGRAIIKCNDSVAAEGVKFDFNGGTATMTSFWAVASIVAGGTSVAGTQIATSLSGAMDFSTITNETLIAIDFSFVSNVAGTIIPRVAQSSHTTGTLTVALGSILQIQDIA